MALPRQMIQDNRRKVEGCHPVPMDRVDQEASISRQTLAKPIPVMADEAEGVLLEWVMEVVRR